MAGLADDGRELKEADLAKILVHNPTAPAPNATEALGAMTSLRESRAGVLANQKQYAALLITSIVDALSERYGVIKALTGSRSTTSAADPAQLDEFAKACDWVITGSAD